MDKTQPITFSENKLLDMKYDSRYGSSSWIKIDNSNKSKTDDYILHATGDADLQGRKYIALPKNTILTSDIKKKYNIM